MQHTIRHPAPLWQRHFVSVWFFLIVAMVGGLAPNAGYAATQEFTVVAVAIDANSETAAAQALDYARKRALYLAVSKLGVANASLVASRIPAVDVAQIIRGSTVLQTRREGQKTYAEVSVTIVDEALKRSLKIADTGPATEPVKLRSVLVLPVFATDKGLVIWKSENQLRDPLATELLRQGHGAIILPGGDLQDLRLIDGQNVSKVTTAELKPMFERYGAEEIIIPILKLGDVGTTKSSEVILRRLGQQDPHDEVLDIPPAKPEDTAQIRLAQASQSIATAVMQIASSTSQNEEAKLAKATKIPVKFVYTIPKDYAQMAAAVRKSPGVLMLELPDITIDNVTGTIYLDGDKTALHKALAAQGIVVRELGNGWTLSAR